MTLLRAALAAAILLNALTATAASQRDLWGRPLLRDGWHVMVAFGWGGGPTSNGLMHSMEIGKSDRTTGATLAYNHLFILSDRLGKPANGSDMFGGHFLVLKLPLGSAGLVGKVGAGLGENVDLSDGFSARFGVGWTYGIDLHLALYPRSGLTLTALVVHAATVDRGHQLGLALGLGYSWF
ncbi:MAG: hypothetical protein H6707_19300 [Deltaproteobacteria bacterium]|nr:hypothetical protein [Deltaproteobacteria bacterium]